MENKNSIHCVVCLLVPFWSLLPLLIENFDFFRSSIPQLDRTGSRIQIEHQILPLRAAWLTCTSSSPQGHSRRSQRESRFPVGTKGDLDDQSVWGREYESNRGTTSQFIGQHKPPFFLSHSSTSSLSFFYLSLPLPLSLERRTRWIVRLVPIER